MSPLDHITQPKIRTERIAGSVHASVLARELDASPERASAKALPAAAVRPDTDIASEPIVARGAGVSDALLEPELAAARARRAGWANARAPIVSLVILTVLLCAAWLI